MKKIYCYLILLMLLAGCGKKKIKLDTQELNSPTNTLLQAISMVDNSTTWVSGHDATFLRTTNAGEDWEMYQHPTVDSLQFRDIHAFSNKHVVLMSAGPGAMSKIYTFSLDSSWREVFVMDHPNGFLDCLDFWDDLNGIAYGDSFDGYPYILLTKDGGNTWKRAEKDRLPLAGKGEGGFAASGTCVTTGEAGKAWIATGAGGNARVLITQDYGTTWEVVDSPLIKGEAAGNTSISFAGQYGFLTGGDLAQGKEFTDNCAFTEDGGASWKLSSRPQTAGAFYGGEIAELYDQRLALAAGPNGVDFTTDDGKTWSNLSQSNYWAVAFQNEAGFAVGKDGSILKITVK